MNTLAIIIPYIDSPEYTRGVLDSLKTKEQYHLIMIDNASGKDCDKLNGELKRRENTTLIRNDQNVGCASAWNQGMAMALKEKSVDKVAVLNNDIILNRECIDRLIKKQEELRYPVITATDMAKECAAPEDVIKMPILSWQFVVDEPEFSCFLISREGYGLIGEFDERFYPAYFEDNDYHYRAKLLKKRLVKTSTALYYHYGSRTIKGNVAIKETVNAYYEQNREYYKEKWGGEPGEEKYKIPFDERRR